MTEMCCEYFSVRCIWLYVIIMSYTSFSVNPHSIVRISLLSLKLQIWHLLRLRRSLTFRQTLRVSIHSETRTWQDNNIRSNAPYRKVLTAQLNHLANLAKWLSVRLRTKWLWARISMLSVKLQIWRLLRATSSLTFRQTIECGFTMKLVRDLKITYSQVHHEEKYLQHSSIIWPVWLNGWVFTS